METKSLVCTTRRKGATLASPETPGRVLCFVRVATHNGLGGNYYHHHYKISNGLFFSLSTSIEDHLKSHTCRWLSCLMNPSMLVLIPLLLLLLKGPLLLLLKTPDRQHSKGQAERDSWVPVSWPLIYSLCPAIHLG